MKLPLPSRFLIGALLLGPAAGWSAEPAHEKALPKVPAQQLSPRFRQVRERIDALFRYRQSPPPATEVRYDPFRPAGAAAAHVPAPGERGAAAPVAAAPEPAADQALLQQSVATLKISGTFEIGGRQHLVINSRPYKEGDVVQTQVHGEPVYLRVRQISRSSITLVLREAETTVKF